MEAQTEGARETAFCIHLIVSKILSECDLRVLKTLRLVSRSWNELAHSEIVKRSLVRLHFYYALNARTYKVYSRWRKWRHHITLQDFVDLIEKSGTLFPHLPFPCQQFCIFMGDLTSSGAFEFFQSHGANIKSLVLTQVTPSESTFVNVLGVQVQNLEKLSLSLGHWLKEWEWVPELCQKPLSISDLDSESDSEEEDEKWEKVQVAAARELQERLQLTEIPFHSRILHELSLPKLHILHFSDMMHKRDFRHGVALQLVKSAPNLKAVANFPITQFPLKYFRENPEKLLVLKEFTLFERMQLNEPYMNVLEDEAENLMDQMRRMLDMCKFGKSQPKLDSLTYGFRVDGLGAICFPKSSELCDVMKLIFILSCETLKTLSWHYSDTLQEMVKVPLVNLQNLELHISSASGTKFYPGFLKTLFPKLSSLHLIFFRGQQKDVSKEPWTKYWEKPQVELESDVDSVSDFPESCILRGVLDLTLSAEFPSTCMKQPDNDNDNCWTCFGRIFPNLQRLTSWAAVEEEVYLELFKLWPNLQVVKCGRIQIRRGKNNGRVEKIEMEEEEKKETDDEDDDDYFLREYPVHQVEIPQIFSLY